MELNKEILERFGLHTAALYAILVREMNSVGEFFPYTKDKIILETDMTRARLKTSIRFLVEAGFIESKVIGLPATTHFKVLK